MEKYWFWDWMQVKGIKDEPSLRKVLTNTKGLQSLIDATPTPAVVRRVAPPTTTEITGGKGLDFTGHLGCRHIECLKSEIDTLFRHVWHYFDVVTVPDEALMRVVEFKDDENLAKLGRGLSVIVPALRYLAKIDGLALVRFELRSPSCRQHLFDHAREAEIEHAVTNAPDVVENLIESAEFEWSPGEEDGHPHLQYRLQHPLFEHTCWGSLCSNDAPLPVKESEVHMAVARDVVRRYLAELCADALAARRSKSALGASIAAYELLLAVRDGGGVDDIAYRLPLPVSSEIPVKTLIRLRQDEALAFQRFQHAIRKAIAERLKATTSSNAEKIALEVRKDLIDPELRMIETKLRATHAMVRKSAGAGIALGAATATIGLMTSLISPPVGAAIALGGVAPAATAIKKALDDRFSTVKDVAASDMYFLWKASTHVPTRSRRLPVA